MHIEEGLERVLITRRRVMGLQKAFFVLPFPSPLPILEKHLSLPLFSLLKDMLVLRLRWGLFCLTFATRNLGIVFAHLECLQFSK